MNLWQGRISRAVGVAALGLALLVGSGTTAFARSWHGGHHGGYRHHGGYHHYHRGGGYYRGYGGLNFYRGGYGYRPFVPRSYNYYPRYRVRRPYYAWPYMYPNFFSQPWYGGGYYRGGYGYR